MCFSIVLYMHITRWYRPERLLNALKIFEKNLKLNNELWFRYRYKRNSFIVQTKKARLLFLQFPFKEINLNQWIDIQSWISNWQCHNRINRFSATIIVYVCNNALGRIKRKTKKRDYQKLFDIGWRGMKKISDKK